MLKIRRFLASFYHKKQLTGKRLDSIIKKYDMRRNSFRQSPGESWFPYSKLM